MPTNRDSWLSNRVLQDHDDIAAHCRHAWNRLIEQPWRIMSIGLREWANRFWSVGVGIREAHGEACANGKPLIAAIILLEQSDEWATQRSRDMTLEAISTVSDTAAVSLSAVPA